MNASKLLLGLTVVGLSAMALTGCECFKCCSSTPAQEAATIKVVNADKLTELIRSPGTATIIDARNWQPGMDIIPSSINIKDENTDAEVAKVLPDKNAMIVTYCANTRCTASPMLAKRLVKLGYTNVWEYPEGIAGWKTAGKEISKVK